VFYRKLKSNIKRNLGTVLKKAGLENVTLYTFRNTFASQLAMAGVSLREIQKMASTRSLVSIVSTRASSGKGCICATWLLRRSSVRKTGKQMPKHIQSI